MSTGLEVYDENGVLVVDYTKTVGIVLGQITTTTAAGQIIVPEFLIGNPWYVTEPIGSFLNGATALPRVRISGDTLSWDYDSYVQQFYRRTGSITYGIS